MFGFRKGQGDASLIQRVTVLEAELSKTQSVVRQLEGEQLLMHDQVRKWMRRAVAAERAVERNQEPAEDGTPAPPARRVRLSKGLLWGARARRLARGAPDPVNDAPPEVEANGVHS
ncbi:MAG TPA: hypothetical protein VJN39_14830 [Gemmatimonadales bacterium]|nr:hypothetical protein [Gemmatimonadales bacterium]